VLTGADVSAALLRVGLARDVWDAATLGAALVRGACSLARRLGVSELAVGLTVVAFGTSAPELVVNIFASLGGQSDITFGNIVGSNQFNILLILGIAGAIMVQSSKIFKNWARNIFVWPAVVAPVVVSVMWLLILDPTVGLVNKILQTLGAQPQIWLDSKTGAFISVVIVDVWHWTPVLFLFIYSGLN
jgi:hypothetical protein